MIEETKAALEMLGRLESEEGVPAKEWLVDMSPEERSTMMGLISEETGWKRIVMLPENLGEREGDSVIRAAFVDGRGDAVSFDELFAPPTTDYYTPKPAWIFTRYVFQRKGWWEEEHSMAAPPHIGGYDDEGNVYMNATGWLDDKLPPTMQAIPRGARVKVVVSHVWEKSSQACTRRRRCR